MKFGLELEFKSHLNKEDILNYLNTDSEVLFKNSLDVLLCDNWALGNDASLGIKIGQKGYELRSPILSEFPYETIKNICKLLKELKADVSGPCGIHWHFSDWLFFKNLSDEELDLLDDCFAISDAINRQAQNIIKISEEIVLKKFGQSIKSSRKRYCNNTRHYKYCPVRFVENPDHCEFRVFNASLNPRFIKHSWEECERILKLAIDKVEK
jgi:hypothetical protein